LTPRKTEKINGSNFTERKVKTQNGISDPFITRRGLRQGDALSCMLINIVVEKAVRVAGLNITGTILHKSVQI
jgi:sorting nexin-29